MVLCVVNEIDFVSSTNVVGFLVDFLVFGLGGWICVEKMDSRGDGVILVCVYGVCGLEVFVCDVMLMF